MSAWFLSIAISVLVAALWHGFSLKIAVVLAGEDSPGLLKAAWVSWLGALLGGGATFLYAITAGLFVGLFSSMASMVLGALLNLFVIGLVYRRGLRLTTPAAYGVAAIHLVLTAVVDMVIGGLFVHFVG